MLKTFYCTILAILITPPTLAQSTEPVGPSGWTARNWVGFFLVIIVFILAVIGINKLATWGEDESRQK